LSFATYLDFDCLPMNADQRLDQLEPLLSESMAILDQHTALLNRHTAQLKQLVNVALQHSESLSYVLREIIEVKEKQAGLAAKQEELANQVSALDDKVSALDDKLDQILGLLNAGK